MPPGGQKTAFERAASPHAITDEITRRKHELAPMISTETGKPLALSEREWRYPASLAVTTRRSAIDFAAASAMTSARRPFLDPGNLRAAIFEDRHSG
ncbi:hypothetical protein FKO01_54005 [Mesorhizobium sp. B2-3-3]|nr:hypothetical protein FKO01_54005 [Mesorhizobium sp. B2-3-3]